MVCSICVLCAWELGIADANIELYQSAQNSAGIQTLLDVCAYGIHKFDGGMELMIIQAERDAQKIVQRGEVPCWLEAIGDMG